MLAALFAVLAAPPQPLEVRVLVLNFDPVIEAEGGKRLHEVGGWNDPRKLSEGYIADVREASGDLIRYRIVEWRDVDDYPVKVDGFRYDDDSYLRELRSGKQWHQPDGMDYERVIAQYGLAEAVSAGQCDEIWLFGAPYFGYWEAAMAGPGAFFINGGVYEKVQAKRPFAIMGFNYERGVAEMLHDLSHRTEATMSKVYGGWKADDLSTMWAKFAANEKQSGTAAVGSCHWPPNAEKDYDYANPRTVLSTADDWLNYPLLSGAKRPVNCETWGGPDYHRNYMRWWFSHLPRKAGLGPDGKLANWWLYVFQFEKTVLNTP